jgi:hypothetical protein
LAPIWCDVLRDVSVDLLGPAFQKLERTFKPTVAAPFPSPAHLLELLSDVRAREIENSAESAWQHLLDRLERQYHPDLGWNGPSLDPRIDHAARAAGGIRWILECSRAELVWCKKRFTECYVRDEKLAEDHALLSPPPEISKRIKDVAAKKSFKPVEPVTSSTCADSDPPVGSRRVTRSTPMTDEQFEARKKLLREQVEKFKAQPTSIRGNTYTPSKNSS